MRGIARLSLGLPDWSADLHAGARIAGPIEPIALSAAIFHAYITGLSYGALLCDDAVLANTAGALRATQLALARVNDSAYQDRRDRYRAMADRLGFQGHMAMAEAMP